MFKRLMGSGFSSKRYKTYPVIFFSPYGGKEDNVTEKFKWRSFRIFFTNS